MPATIITDYPSTLHHERLRERGRDVTAKRIAKYFHIGGRTTASPRSATFPRLTGDALSFDNRSRQVAECDGAAVSVPFFHSSELPDV